MQPQALFFLMASMPTIAYARAVKVREESFSEFSGTCEDGVSLIDGSVVQATCRATPPGFGPPPLFENKLDLNKCIGLDSNGRLTLKEDGQFADGCDMDTCDLWAGRDFTCKCGEDGVMSTIDLDKGIGNDEGTLKCAGGEAKVTELEDPYNDGDVLGR